MQSTTEKDLINYITPTISEVFKSMVVETNKKFTSPLIVTPQQFLDFLKLFKKTRYKIVAKRIINVLDIIISFNFTDRCLN